MPVKNAASSSTTWYRSAPTQPLPSPRHQQPPTSKPPTSGAHCSIQQAHHSPKNVSIPQQPSGLSLTTDASKRNSTSQIPGASSSHSGNTSPLLPSKLPTSTSSSASSSPKRTIPHSKIASPIRHRNADRLPPITKVSGSASAAFGAEQSQTSGLKKMVTGVKAKTKEEKTGREKTNENRIKGSNGEVTARKDSNREVVKSGKISMDKPKENEGIRKKSSSGDSKLETKTIPKRKKSERSNSEGEIKAKKMTIKDHLICPTTSSTSTAAVEGPREKPSPTKLLKGRPADRIAKGVKEGRKPSPSTLKLSQPRLHLPSTRDPVKTVEKLMKQMNVRKPRDNSHQFDAVKETDLKGDEVRVENDEKFGQEKVVIIGTEEHAKMDEEELEVNCSQKEDDAMDEDESIEGEYELKDEMMATDEDMSVVRGGGQDTMQNEEEAASHIDGPQNLEREVPVNHDSSRGIKRLEGGDEMLEGVEIVMDDNTLKVYVPEHDNTIHIDKDGDPVRGVNGADVCIKEGCSMEESAIQDNESPQQNAATDSHGTVNAIKDADMQGVALACEEASTTRDPGGVIGDTILREKLSPVVHKAKSIEEDMVNGVFSVPRVSNDDEAMATDTEQPEVKRCEDAVEMTKVEKEKEKGSGNKESIHSGMKVEQRKLNLKDVTNLPADRGDKEDKKIKRSTDVKSRISLAGSARKKKSIKQEEQTKTQERSSKRKIDTERSRSGTKKPARLSVDRDVDKLATTSRPVSPCPSDVSSSSAQSFSSNLSRVSSRLPVRALHVSSPARVGSITSLCSTASAEGSRGSRDSRILATNRANIAAGEKKRSESSVPPRRPRLDNIKSTIPKAGRLPPRKLTDPVKAARPGGANSGPRGPHVGHGGSGPGQQHPAPHADQLRRLEAEVAARNAELKAARVEREQAERGVEALTVLLHHLTNTYDPFCTPRLKAEVVRLTQQLTEARLNYDESSAAVRRLQEAAATSVEQHDQKVQQLEQQHRSALEQLTKQHQHELDLALEKHRKEVSEFAEEQQNQREALSRAHSAELEQLETEWRTKLDMQHEQHLSAVQELNTRHTHKLRELESSRQAREYELEEANYNLTKEQENLKNKFKKLEETLLNDTDHRLQAVRNMCSSLKSEVDSLKTVVEMKNVEIHDLRGQVAEMGRLTNELELTRDRTKSLQAKTEDLQAQMEKRTLSERHLVNEHRLLVETCQREANINKRLSLENEELAWKLRQREEAMSTSMPASTLDLVSRSPAAPRRQEGAPSPQAAPRSPRVAVRSPSGKISPSKCDINKRRSRLGFTPNGDNAEDAVQEVSFESPPPSPCVKAVVEKSNSVSFILDLNDSQSDDSFLDLPPSPRPRPHRTASLSAADRPRTPTYVRRVIHNNRANSMKRIDHQGEEDIKNVNGKSKELNGKVKDPSGKAKEVNGKSNTNGHGSRMGSGRSASESSEGGSEMERVSPTGLAWTVPVHPPKSPVKTNVPRQNGSPSRGRIEHHLLEDPDEDEYEETPGGTHQFIEVVELSGVGLTSSSEAASDSELSQCDLIKEGSSTESDSDSSDAETHTQQGSTTHQPIERKSGPWCPKDGAGESMITDELLTQYAGDPALGMEPRSGRGKRPTRCRLPSAPSSDSDDNVNTHNDGTAVDVSWSEDVDITSSSEMHEL